jgi:hypothetical protein
MEVEPNDHLPFLDIDKYRRLDVSLGHTVYRKAINTNPYLNAELHHHLANTHSVLPTLVHEVRTICIREILPGELEFLCTMFK